MAHAVQVASIGRAFGDLWKDITDVGPRWLVALAVLVATWLIARLARMLVQKAVGRTSTQGHVDLLIARGAGGLVWLAGTMVALSEVGMSFSAALATVGLASVGIGFALQGVLSNLFSGIILLVQHPFTIGDQIRVGDQEGVVENIRVRDTQILTYDGRRVFIPNKTVFDSPIINYSATPTMRIDLRVPLEGGQELAVERKHALEAMMDCDDILQQPEPLVLVETDREATVLVLRFWASSDRNRASRLESAVLEKLKQTG